MSSQLKSVLIGLLVACYILFQSSTAFGQVPQQVAPQVLAQKAQPPMENVFFNVLWGSFTGGLLMMGWATLDDTKTGDERYALSNMTSSFLSGATYGGLLGLAAGVYISLKGITFDERRTKIAILQPPHRDFFPTAKYSKHSIGFNSEDLHLIDLQIDF